MSHLKTLSYFIGVFEYFMVQFPLKLDSWQMRLLRRFFYLNADQDGYKCIYIIVIILGNYNTAIICMVCTQ